MVKFPKIQQLRTALKNAREAEILGTVTFEGTVKIHGTNAAIAVDENGEITAQSRTRIITPVSDNAGFACFVHSIDKTYLSEFRNTVFFGEWCGAGIQRGVGVNSIDKRIFVIFAIKTLDVWQSVDMLDATKLNSQQIYLSSQFDSFSIEIDISNPHLSLPELERITKLVADECPVAKHFGHSGLGEGVVWRMKENPSSDFWFKVKDERHSNTKIKKLVTVDVEKLSSIAEFVEYAVTENRMQQGIDILIADGVDVTSRQVTGTFLKWLFNDVISEELDTIVASGLTPKDVGAAISIKGRNYLFNQQDSYK